MNIIFAIIGIIFTFSFFLQNLDLGRIARYITNHQLWWVLILGAIILFMKALSKRK